MNRLAEKYPEVGSDPPTLDNNHGSASGFRMNLKRKRVRAQHRGGDKQTIGGGAAVVEVMGGGRGGEFLCCFFYLPPPRPLTRESFRLASHLPLLLSVAHRLLGPNTPLTGCHGNASHSLSLYLAAVMPVSSLLH